MELPEVTNSTELEALRRTPERWMPVVSEIAHSHYLDSESLEDLGGANLVAAIGTDYVIKLIPDVYSREFDAETRALSLLEKHMSAMTPQILATNSSKTWKYIVMTRVRGEPLSSRREEMPTSDLLNVLHEIGRLLAVLHGLEFEPDELVTPSSWTQFLSLQERLCAARQARWGVHDH